MKPKSSPYLTPLNYVYQTLHEAFNSHSKRHKALHIAVRNILKLAKGRGYPYSTQLIQLFNVPGVSLDVSAMLIRRLLAYVSVNEFVALSEHTYRPVKHRAPASIPAFEV